MILDAETYEPVAASHLLVGELASGVLKTELHASVIELTTPVCRDADEAIASLRSLPIVQEERYLSMVRDLGHTARRQGVNGLHVHVGVAGDLWERLEAVL